MEATTNDVAGLSAEDAMPSTARRGMMDVTSSSPRAVQGQGIDPQNSQGHSQAAESKASLDCLRADASSADGSAAAVQLTLSQGIRHVY